MIETTQSADGTTIAFERTGSGPPLILVGGAFSDRTGAAPFIPLLAPAFTAVAIDRRGRGDSTDTQPYAVEREIEDLQAVVAAVGGEAFVYGHSSGGVLSLLATSAGLPVTKLAVYEPPFMIPGTREIPGADYYERIDTTLEAGDRATVVETFFTEAVQMPPGVLKMIEGSPMWPGMLAVADTIPYENAIVGDGTIPTDRLATISVPTLVMDGGASPDWARQSVAAVAAAIPGSTTQTFPGQEHNAAPDLLATALTEFFLA